jgi:hypothetical protein
MLSSANSSSVNPMDIITSKSGENSRLPFLIVENRSNDIRQQRAFVFVKNLGSPPVSVQSSWPFSSASLTSFIAVQVKKQHPGGKRPN